MMKKDRLLEVGLTIFFLLFVIGMTTDVTSLFQHSQTNDRKKVLAATTKRSTKTKPTPQPSPKSVLPTWTPVPLQVSPEVSSTEFIATPTPAPPVTSKTTPIQQSLRPTEPKKHIDESHFPDDENDRKGLLDTIGEIVDLKDTLPL